MHPESSAEIGYNILKKKNKALTNIVVNIKRDTDQGKAQTQFIFEGKMIRLYVENHNMYESSKYDYLDCSRPPNCLIYDKKVVNLPKYLRNVKSTLDNRRASHQPESKYSKLVSKTSFGHSKLNSLASSFAFPNVNQVQTQTPMKRKKRKIAFFSPCVKDKKGKKSELRSKLMLAPKSQPVSTKNSSSKKFNLYRCSLGKKDFFFS